MSIGVDGNDANVDQQVGVSVYTLNLLQYFQSHATAERKFKIYLREQPKTHLPPPTEFYEYKVIPAGFLWSQIFLPMSLNTKKEIDVFFSPAHYTPRFCPVPLVVTIHDLAYFYYPQEFLKKDLFKLQNWTKDSIEKAQKIITVSKTTKKDVLKFYSVDESKIAVVYNGYEKHVHHDDIKKEEVLNRWNLSPQKFVLYVSTLQPRKNVITLIRAFNAYLKDNPDFKLVLTGKKGWMFETIFKEVENLELTEKVIFTDFVSDAEVNVLYQNAFCFVLPSLYEGFGIPVLEAMSHSCPVITSFSSSLPEVGDEACLYFDPKSEKDLLDKLRVMQLEKGLRDDLIKKGLERVKLFSWTTCGQQTLEVIEGVVKKS
jgi:glycosyltransferase involved in cell wall biosynthesis